MNPISAPIPQIPVVKPVIKPEKTEKDLVLESPPKENITNFHERLTAEDATLLKD
jgi:hypothetical protein